MSWKRAAALECGIVGAVAVATAISCGSDHGATGSDTCEASDCVGAADAGNADVQSVPPPGDDGGALPEAGADGGAPVDLAHFLDGWVLSSWAPGCGLYQPGSAVVMASVPPVVWQPCESGRAGCEQTAYRGSSTVREIGEAFLGPSPTGAVRLSMLREYGQSTAVEAIIWDSDVGVVAAWRMNGVACEPQVGDVGNGGLTSLSLYTYTPFSKGSFLLFADQWWQAVGQPADMMARKTADYTFDGGVNGRAAFNVISTSSSLLSMYYGARNNVFVLDRATQGQTQITFDDGGAAFVERGAVLHDDTFFFSDENSVFSWTRGGPGIQVLVSSPTAAEHDVGTDGTTLTWMESADADQVQDGWNGATLYASPYATTAAGLVPTKVRKLPGCTSLSCTMSVNEGYAVVGDDSSVAAARTITRLTDGMTWKLTAIVKPQQYNESWTGTVLYSGGKIWVQWSDIHNTIVGFQRVDLSSLPILN